MGNSYLHIGHKTGNHLTNEYSPSVLQSLEALIMGERGFGS